MAMDITAIQRALKKSGFDPGKADGVWGRRTIAAVKAFQEAHGLEVDGILGPETARALTGNATAPTGKTAGIATPLVWFEEALSLVGTEEKPGKESNEKIIAWAKRCNIDYKSDDIPWCGLFVAHCIGATLPEEPMPTTPLLARSWRKFGNACQPVQGAVLVFWRGSKDGTTGHVGFYRSEDDEAFHVLGGNQRDSVNTCRIGKDRLLAARWPRTAASLQGEKVKAKGVGKLSHDEA
jgi:uncharacterized protein (TIGR02594 family)